VVSAPCLSLDTRFPPNFIPQHPSMPVLIDIRPADQAMVENIYDHFRVLYESILPKQTSLAAEHALKQENEIYQRTTKITYRNVRRSRYLH
jgi:hypothetical protein